MKFLHFPDIKRLIWQSRAEGVSMRRSLAFSFISALSMVLSLILLLLNLFGIMNPANRQIMDSINLQLSGYVQDLEHDYDKTAAYAISFSEQLEVAVQNYLSENGLTLDDLENNATAITELQCRLYHIVYLHMQLAPSSGAFYLLDTTVNNKTTTPLYNGIYLKYVNLNSENTVNNAFSLYRGSFVVGNTNGINFHSGWQNELKTDFFETYDTTFADGAYYALSPTVIIPETWENARYIYVPIHDLKGECIGVCGFEINDLFFQLTHKATDGQLGPVVYGLLDYRQGFYNGQFSSSRFSISNDSTSTFTIIEKKDWLIFDFGTEKCIGKVQPVQLGKDTFSAVIMLTQAQYEHFLQKGKLQFSVILLIVTAFSLLCCLFLSNRYVTPILKKIEQIKANEESGDPLRIREIDDLFAFLSEKDSHYEAQLSALEKAKLEAEEEAQRTKAAYDSALEKYRLAHSELLQLSDDWEKEIVLEDYKFFLANLSTLTPTEYRIYALYLAGKSAKEIMEITGIKTNTLKYHNKNIYSKLGISSRKQLLRFAALKQHQDSREAHRLIAHPPLSD